MKTTHILPLLILLLLISSGCGSDKPKSYDCTGTVTLDGEPVEGANVAFINVKLSAPVAGRTDSEGKFTFKSEPGDFNVTIVKLSGGATDADPYAPSKNLLPEQYASSKTSGLKATVESVPSKNIYEFKLEK